MSQPIYFSVSSDDVEGLREGKQESVRLASAIASNDDVKGIEYLNNRDSEYVTDIKSDIELAQKEGLSPYTMHFSHLDELGSEDGEIQLNTSVRNCQLYPDGARESYWSPENIILHPPVSEADQEQEMRQNMINNITETQKINERDERVSGRLLIENMPPIDRWLLESPQDIRALESDASELGVQDELFYVLDVGHTANWRKMLDAMPSDRIHEVHLHNKRQVSDNRWENHLPTYEGEYNIGDFLDEWESEIPHAPLVLELRPDVLSPETVDRTVEHLLQHLD